MKINNNVQSKTLSVTTQIQIFKIIFCVVLLLIGSNFVYAQPEILPCKDCDGDQDSGYVDPDDPPHPVELASFSASVDRNDVILSWTTAGEINNSGFDIERKLSVSGDWAIVGNVKGNGTVDKYMYYTYEDKSLQTGRYNYRLKQIDLNGNFEYFLLTEEILVGIPTKYNLSQNYPNPFNPMTRIDYDLPYDGKVSIVLYDILGREAAKLVNEVKSAGYYYLDFNASNLSSGPYFYKITAEANGRTTFEETKRMMLVK